MANSASRGRVGDLILNIGFNSAAKDPISATLDAQNGCVLAIIAGVEGPSYRPLGAMMAIQADGTRIGTLSSGCIEADIALHALETLDENTPRLVRYGRGSPFKDIELPCGGGLEILLVPNPNRSVLSEVRARQKNRQGCTLKIDVRTGSLGMQDIGITSRTNTDLTVRFDPEIRFLVFGKGPEASTFSALVKSAGYPILLLSPDEETLLADDVVGCESCHLTSHTVPSDIKVDEQTVVVLFFHDHEWEPPILYWALKTKAFYIGSQGSQRARDARNVALGERGVAATDIERLHGPIGLIPSARDAGTLAVSVLAEVLAVAMRNAV